MTTPPRRRRSASRQAGPPSPGSVAENTTRAARQEADPQPPESGAGGHGRHERGSGAQPQAQTQSQTTQTAPDRMGPPPKLRRGGLRVVALGGIGEVGRNMTVFEYDGRLLIVDCGVLFPEDAQPGVDLILPDFRYIEDRIDDVEAVILTHGHEDHIGAVPFLLPLRGDIPVVGSTFTLALLEANAGAGHRGRTDPARAVRL